MSEKDWADELGYSSVQEYRNDMARQSQTRHEVESEYVQRYSSRCSACDGRGYIVPLHADFADRERCTRCEGTGKP